MFASNEIKIFWTSIADNINISINNVSDLKSLTIFLLYLIDLDFSITSNNVMGCKMQGNLA